MNTPVIPFITGDGLVHRVAAETQRVWIEKHRYRTSIELWTQCGDALVGRIHPEGSHLVTCLQCLAFEGPEAAW